MTESILASMAWAIDAAIYYIISEVLPVRYDKNYASADDR